MISQKTTSLIVNAVKNYPRVLHSLNLHYMWERLASEVLVLLRHTRRRQASAGRIFRVHHSVALDRVSSDRSPGSSVGIATGYGLDCGSRGSAIGIATGYGLDCGSGGSAVGIGTGYGLWEPR
jgi:hypothetical protein